MSSSRRRWLRHSASLAGLAWGASMLPRSLHAAPASADEQFGLFSYEVVDGSVEITDYPSDAAGNIVSPLVEMAAIADAYDAMTTLRSYQRPFTPRKAIARLKDISGSSLHPEFVMHFVDSLGAYPVGSLVRLDNNEIGLVTKVDTQDTSLVDIKILFNPAGTLLDEPFKIQLRPNQPRRIIAEVDPQTKGIDVTDFFDLGS